MLITKDERAANIQKLPFEMQKCALNARGETQQSHCLRVLWRVKHAPISTTLLLTHEQAPIFLFATSPVDLPRRPPTIRGRAWDGHVSGVGRDQKKKGIPVRFNESRRQTTSRHIHFTQASQTSVKPPLFHCRQEGGEFKKNKIKIKQNRKADRVDQTPFTERTSKTAPKPLADRVANLVFI